MSDHHRQTGRLDDRGPVRPDGRRAPRPPTAPVDRLGPGPARQRIPTPAQLAALLVNGLLRLPRGYRRGMFLDILV